LNLHPNKYLMISQLKMASAQGCCKPFGKDGDGFVPSEGVGAILLKPLEAAKADNDHIYAVIKATAVNHDGKTNGYMVPNPQRQAELIQKALNHGMIDPRTISYIEAHGTGTSLGDPIEIGGLTQAFRKYTQDQQFCAVGSVKSNIGHLEAASGIAALTKVLLQMEQKQLVPSIHTQQLNENIKFEDSPFYVQRELTPWERHCIPVNGECESYPRLAGISSFGAGGANAHIILEEYDNDTAVSDITPPSPQIILVSAKNEERLKVVTNQLHDYICKNIIVEESGSVSGISKVPTDCQKFSCRSRAARAVNAGRIRLIDVAYTLKVGREPMEERLALLTSDFMDLCAKLKAFYEGRTDIEDSYRWSTKTHGGDYKLLLEGEEGKAFVYQLIQNRKLLKLIRLWGAGVQIDWEELHAGWDPRRISLPTYPFETSRYWLPEVEKVIANDKNRAVVFSKQENPCGLSVDSLPTVKSTEFCSEIQYLVKEWKEKSSGELVSREIAPVGDILVFDGGNELFTALQNKSRFANARIIRVKPGKEFSCESDSLFCIDPAKQEDYDRLFSELEESGFSCGSIIHCWSSDRFDGSDETVKLQLAQSLYSIFFISRTLLSISSANPVRLIYLYTSDADGGQPLYQAVTGFARSLHLETNKLKIETVEFAMSKETPGSSADLIAQVVLETLDSATEEYIEQKCLNGKRLISGFREWMPNSLRTGDSISIKSIPVRKNGCYLITGGAGGIGLIFSRYLTREHQAKVVMVGRSEQPPAVHNQPNLIETPHGRIVYYRADIAKQDQVESLIRDIKARFGEINGVFHCAGVIRDALIHQKKLEAVNEVLAPKVRGTICLDQCLREENIDFFILFSSISSQLGNIGQSDYAYANNFMDSFATWREWMRSRGRRHGRTISISWPLWEKGGMSVDEHILLRFKRIWGMPPLNTEAGLKAFETVIGEDISHVMVMAGDKVKVRQALLPSTEQHTEHEESKTSIPSTGDVEPVPFLSYNPNELNMFLREKVSALTGITPDKVDEDVEFWDIGIDSILAMQIINAIEDKYGLTLYPNELWEHNTVKKLNAYLQREIHRSRTSVTDVNDNNKLATRPLCYILSTPRAGSTLLRVMLMGNSRIFAPPELHLLQFDSLNERKQKLQRSNRAFLREGLIETIKVLDGINVKDAISKMEDLENKGLSIAETYQFLGHKVGDRILVDKSPTYGEHFSTLRKAETIGGKPLYIFLVRHPLSMMASFVKNRFDKMLNIKEDPWRYAERLWVKINTNIMRFFDDIPADRKIFIRYEDLVGASEKTLKELCQWFDVDFENEMLKPYRDERMIHGLHQKSITIGDPGFLKYKDIVPERAEAWKAHTNRLQELESATTALARKLGYSMALDSSGVSPEPITMECRRQLPLSPAQQSILNRLGPHPHWGIVEQLHVKLDDSLDMVRFNDSLRKVIERHSVLSHSFTEVDNALIQYRQESVELDANYKDLSSYGATEIEVRLKEMEKELIACLNIEKAPLMAVGVAALGENRYAVVAVFHMLIADGRMCEIILEDIFKHYQDSHIEVLPVDTRYADYIASIESMKEEQLEEKHNKYWLEEIKGPTTTIPADYKAKSTMVESGEIYYETFSFEELLINSQANKGKLFLYISVGLYRYLSTVTGHTAPIITHRFHRRNLADFGSYFDLAGRFAGDVPMRLSISSKDTVKKLIRTFQKLYNDIPLQGLTYEMLANNGKIPSAALVAPILLNFQYGQPRIPSMIKCKWHQFEKESDARDYEIDLIVRVRTDSVRVIAKYSNKRYKRQTIEKTVRSWIETVKDIIAKDQD